DPPGRGGDPAEDVAQARDVGVVTAVKRQLELRPPDGEGARLVRADLERGVAELVVVGGRERVARARDGPQRGRDPPARARRRYDRDAAGALELARDVEEQAGAVPVAVAVIEERRAHARLEREHAVTDAEGAA